MPLANELLELPQWAVLPRPMQAALGTMWAHAVNTRLVLMQTQGGCQLCNTSLNSPTALLAGGCRHSRCVPAYRSSQRHPPSHPSLAGHRFLHVAKSPAAPSTIFAYRVTAAGAPLMTARHPSLLHAAGSL